jgi:hypothetical protein
MSNFAEKLVGLSKIFIYKFNASDYGEHKLKLYYISLDDEHLYCSINGTAEDEDGYIAEIGSLHLSKKTNEIFEDSPNAILLINKSEIQFFKDLLKALPNWSNDNLDKLHKNYWAELTV